VKFYRFKCACGKFVELVADEFRGKRKMLDCGCGVNSSKEVLEKVEKRKKELIVRGIKTIYLRLNLIQELTVMAENSSVSFNKMAEMVLDEGVKAMKTGKVLDWTKPVMQLQPLNPHEKVEHAVEPGTSTNTGKPRPRPRKGLK
jgi:hypothetical protein